MSDDKTLLVLGGSGSGMTQLLEQLRAYQKGRCIPGNEMRRTYPTLGMDVSKLQTRRGGPLKVIELGGSMLALAAKEIDKGNPLSGVLFVVDATRESEIPLGVTELYNLLRHPRLMEQKVPVLLAFNKADAPSALSPASLRMSYGIEDIDPSEHDLETVFTSGTCATNVELVSAWIFRKIFASR